MKNIAATAKKVLTGVLLLGALCVYGGPAKSKQKQTQIGYCKTNQNNDSAVVFVSGRDYIFSQDQRSDQTKIFSSREVKTKEIKIDDVFFVVEGTVVYNLQNILICKKEKSINRSVKAITQKTKSYKNITEAKKNKLVKPRDICFSNCNNQHYQVSISDIRYCTSTISGNYCSQLIVNYLGLTSFFAFSTDLQREYHIHSTSYFFIKSFTIRPPPDGCKFKHIKKFYVFQDLTGSKSC